MKNTMKKGFTLIELMVVVIIVGILAAVAVPKMAANKDRSIASEAVAALGTLNSAAAVYQVEVGDANTDTTVVSLANLIAQGYITEADLNGTYFTGAEYTTATPTWDNDEKKFDITSIASAATSKSYSIDWNADANAYQTKVVVP